MKNLDSRSHQNSMTDIQVLIMTLAKSLSNLTQDYILYFNNLFINDLLAKTLKQLDIEVIRITQVNTSELFLSLILRQFSVYYLMNSHLFSFSFILNSVLLYQVRRELAFCEFEDLQSVFLQDEDNFKYVCYLAISVITNS